MENFDNFTEFPIVLGVNGVRFPKKFTHVIFSPKRNTKKKVGMIGQCRGNSLTLTHTQQKKVNYASIAISNAVHINLLTSAPTILYFVNGHK